MIVFYGENFTLNLTNTKITLVEENPLFFNYFVRNYTWPFSKEIDDETSSKLGFLDLENSTNYKTKFYGKLQIDDTFDEAYLLISNHKGNVIEGTIYYGKSSFTLLDKQLSSLPFPVISTSNNLITHAKEVIDKQFPEVGYNFPMVINDKFKETTKYEKFEGVINQYKNGNFVTNSNQSENGETVAYNRNIIVPFPYLMEILKVGFASENMIMNGSFVSDRVNEKILIYTDKYLEKFYSGLPEGFQFTTANEVWQNGVVSADYYRYYTISQIGSYSVQLFLNIPNSVNVLEFKVEHNTEIIYTSTSNSIDKKLIVNIESTDDLGSLKFYLKLRKHTSNPSNGIGNIKDFNNFSFSFSDGQLNIFPNSFSLSEIMPEMTFGTFLNKLKNWLNLEITFDKNVVSINYIETKFLEVDFKNETDFEIEKPKRTFNQNKLYKISTGNDVMYVSSEGVVNSKDGYREEDIIKIDMGLQILNIEAIDTLFTAKRKGTEQMQLFLYDGLKNDLPVAVSNVFSRNYSLEEVYNRYWTRWIYFRLNSEIFKDKFPVHILDKFNITSGRFKYNKKHIYKKLRKRRVLENYWEMEIESESLS
jgi:hypothetical protein